MSENVRKVGDKLRLKISLSDGRTDKFVRAYLKDQDGVNLSPAQIDLLHLGNGVYSDDTLIMPNKDQIHVVFRVFQDLLFSILDTSYTQALDLFVKDKFDPTALVPKTYAVFARFERSKIKGTIDQDQGVKAQFNQSPALKGLVGQGSVKVLFSSNEIEGVLND